VKGRPAKKDERPVEEILAGLAARALAASGEAAPVEELLADARACQGARRAEKLAKGRIPGPPVTEGVSQGKLNRKLRKMELRAVKVSEAIARLEARAHAEGDTQFKVTEFPWLDWKIRAEVWKILRDVTGKAARIMASALPPAQAQRLIEAARELEDGYASMRWRELVAMAWASWRLSRPVRARSQTKESPEKRLGDYALGYLAPEPEEIAPPVKRVNPWKGGRVVEGYARGAFALLMPDLETGKPRSVSTLFYRNGSGQLGPVSSLSQRGLRLFTRVQPPSDKTTFKGPKRKNAKGQTEQWALGQHWYPASMCGRRTATDARRGRSGAYGVLQELVPWLFEQAPSAGALVEAAEEHEDALAGTVPSAEPAPSVEAPSPSVPEPAPPD
jgi:hypothetical protein